MHQQKLMEHPKKTIITIIAVGILSTIGLVIADGLDIGVTPPKDTQEITSDESKNDVVETNNQSEKEELSENATQYCGANLSCFSDAVRTCSPAIGTFTSTVEDVANQGPVIIDTQTLEINLTNKGCLFSQTINSAIVFLRPEVKAQYLADGKVTEEQIDQSIIQTQIELNERVVNKKGTCIFSDQVALNKRFNEFQKKIRGEEFSDDVYSHNETKIGADYCFGPLYE
ncbi:MAG: hypothetical protein COU06_02565 [Candidatus Harrisonbacteria bacterium CG10_big_fil_rev_8_21_14_0_10_38_8]|uniref:Uncharacterized protein n=1 Tax=Candidatus Harrisonbacteria bacterium CG10_big_fil_rev_8_21_14_0_10_38_8 TaxID=1974582 RepID=A0A2M6WJL6_9BACT|nr:MAG: hypothetical protein COU06_02565 [Candidatus Harrisonbacteria bacterium CG10_big_fil_rev_8_21_14_0_10_38_8]